MFRGINSATLDAKGRMALPTRFRESVQVVAESKLVVTIDMRERCLLMYTLPEWEVVQSKLAELSNIREQARLLQPWGATRGESRHAQAHSGDRWRGIPGIASL